MALFKIITFGCKVNQCDSAWLTQKFIELGWQPAPAGVPPKVAVVNTCTVTARADQQARQALRRLARQHPESLLAVTGCYAQRNPGELAALPQVRLVCGNRDKDLLPDLVNGLNGLAPEPFPLIRVSDFRPEEPLKGWGLRQFPGHCRAWLKIQEGCQQGCSYCIVPLVRGPSRSLPLPLVKAALQDLSSAGYPEIVLTGINLGRYGRDLKSPHDSSQTKPDDSGSPAYASDLTTLLKDLAQHPWPCRLRLSSLEPQEITPVLLDILADWTHFCPHFHLPVQSGASPVLAAMQRPYSPQEAQDIVWDIRRRFPEAAIGLDVLVGFPTETARDFEVTRAFVASLPISYLHVFPFSPRPGTTAASLPALPTKEVQARARYLRDLGRQKKEHFYRRQLGQMGEVVVEGKAAAGWLRGLSANYLKVLLPEMPLPPPRRLRVRFVSLQDEFLVAEPLK